MNYVITFSDVMAGVITLGLGIITFFIKQWFKSLNTQTEKIEKKIDENDKSVNKRIDELEQKTEKDIKELQSELKAIEKDFPIVYVQRDDFFRSMNGVEQQMRNINDKIDKLLLQNNHMKQ